MLKDIRYSGLSVIPSDYTSQDGELAVLDNLIQEHGGIHPIVPPEEVLQLGEHEQLLYVHKTTSYTHLIFIDDTHDSMWYIEEGSTTTHTIPLPSTLSAQDQVCVNSIGNTLLFSSQGTERHTTYYLWADGTYKLLGEHLPELTLSFGLQSEVVKSDNFTISFERITAADIFNELTDANKELISNQVLAKVNKFIADNSTNAGRFIYPFFVRYAYRLYDLSLTMHSAPILMIASTDLSPQAFWTDLSSSGHTYYDSATLNIIAVRHQLDYYATSQLELSALEGWSDIISSVDIFISKPIYTYDQNGKCTRFSNEQWDDSFFVGKMTNQTASESTYPLRYQRRSFKMAFGFAFSPSNPSSYSGGRLLLPSRSFDAVSEDIRNCADFYFLKSIKISELTTETTVLSIPDDYLKSLVVREHMTDDYDSHDLLIPHSSQVYNSRLNLSGLQKKLFTGYNAAACFCRSDGYVSVYSDAVPTSKDGYADYRLYVYIKQDGRDIIVEGGNYAFAKRCCPLVYFYYPNRNAYKIVVSKTVYGSDNYTIPLENHPFLNGAFAFIGWKDIEDVEETYDYIAASDNAIVDISSKLYTSQVNNPFVFPLEGIRTIGVGKILGLATAAKAMSQGQFGQFPLYAFTNECVWALTPSDTGLLQPAQPIVRDVCINADSITQLDSEVLFATDRGIMLLSGSNATCITDLLGLDEAVDMSQLNGLSSLTTGLSLSYVPLSAFLPECRIIYSYVKQRIIIYNPSYAYSYVYSNSSKTWAVINSNVIGNVLHYPHAYAIRADRMLVDYNKDKAETESGVQYKGLLVTRPLKLDAPDIYKTIYTILQRGKIKRNHVSCVLYGSNDLYTWLPVWSSKDSTMRNFGGSPYKYFRIAVIGSLEKDETITGCTIDYQPKLTNRLR